MALLQHTNSDLATDTGVNMLICFDHEEIGSESAQVSSDWLTFF